MALQDAGSERGDDRKGKEHGGPLLRNQEFIMS